MMKILSRYLLTQHVLFLVFFLAGGCGIYLLIDVFDRLDNFIKKDAPIDVILKYFLFKIPLIIAQILPIVYLIALITLFFVLKKRNELIALQCGGIHFFTIIILFLVYSLCWCAIELVFSQVFGVMSERRCDYLWDTMGKKKAKQKVVKNLWFRKGNKIIHVERVDENTKEGFNIKIFFVNNDFRGIQKVIKAKRVVFRDRVWVLKNGYEFNAVQLAVKRFEKKIFNNMPQVTKMVLVKKEGKVEKLNPWQLLKVISSLKRSGTSIESLLFVWHKKIAYSFSIFVLTLFAFCLIRSFDSLFILLSVALAVVFLLYALFNFSEHFFTQGTIPFWLGAWLADMVGLGICGVWFWIERKRTY